MEIWIDAQLSPSLALWMNQRFSGLATAHSIRALGLRDSKDKDIFQRAKAQGAIVMTKDADFAALVQQFGAPPQIIWITAGNTTNTRMREILEKHFLTIVEMISNNEILIEIEGD